MPTIEEAIQQPKFRNSLHRMQVNILYTSNWLNNRTMLALKPHGLSLQQFNILRILRGRGDRPSTIKLLTERMLDKMSNASRLVDKLKEKGLVQRDQCPTDRRQVDIRITEKGLEVLEAASHSVEANVEESLGNLNDEEATILSNLLDKMRGDN
ncbi:MarR family winged helix-turn-helix transcriptional regulator [Lewinella sp. 4G2]|uniref:MarR family winged helix-turn-helix transcriptional regulator n=1 Tax=Lewinella sp. 4G2 TaxID=1803372 RepID=UPI0007B46C16|nr:MarR family transcriptional regulator [Lewinella sp. 4G2]OAV46051.1 transcriptional regulator [Lewinella sp. 4G2]